MEFFAAANTKNGFVSIFDSVFSGIERLYILKGSSGCGKSTFMRRVAAEAQKRGMETDLIFCSSDPESLDGVIIKPLSLAVADGTAPHTMDVKYPCVRESIINLGQFWNEAKLLPHTEKIISLTDRKAKHYKNAYRCLSALGTVKDMISESVLRFIDREKLEESAFALAEKACGTIDRGYKEIFSAAFGSNGLSRKASFGNVKTLYRVGGKGAEFMLLSIWQIVREKNLSAVVSHDPIDPSVIDSVWFPADNTLITLRSEPPCISFDEEKKISMARFTEVSAMSSVRGKLRMLERIASELSEEAKNEFALAKTIHNAIESIYIPAMDFSSMDAFTEEFCLKKIAKTE